MASTASSPKDGPPSEVFKVGDPITTQLLEKLNLAQKNDKLLREMSRAYKKAMQTRKSVESILKAETPIESLAEVDALSDYFKNMNLKVKIGNEEIMRLNNQLKAANSQTSDSVRLLTEKDEVSKKLQTAQIEKDEVSTKLQIAQTELLRKAGQYDELNAMLVQKKEECSRLSHENQKLKATNINIDDLNTQLEKTISELDKEHEISLELCSKLQNLESVNTELKSKLVDTESTNKEFTLKLVSLESTNEKLNKEIDEKVNLNSLLTTENEKLKAEMSSETLESIIEKVKNGITNNDFDINTLGQTAMSSLKQIKESLDKNLVPFHPHETVEEAKTTKPDAAPENGVIYPEPSLTEHKILEILNNFIPKPSLPTSAPNKKPNKNKNKQKKATSTTATALVVPDTVPALEDLNNLISTLTSTLVSHYGGEALKSRTAQALSPPKPPADQLVPTGGNEENKQQNSSLRVDLNSTEVNSKNSNLVQGLQTKVADLEHENFALKDKLQTLQKSMKELNETITAQDSKERSDEYDKEIEKLNEEINRVIDMYSTLEVDFEQVANEKAGLATKLSALEKEIAILSDKKSELSNQVSLLEKDITVLNDEKGGLFKQISQMKTEKESAAKKVEEHVTAVDKLTSELLESNEKSVALEKEAERLRAEAKELTSVKTKLESKMSEFDQKLASLSSESLELKSKVSTAEASVDQSNKEKDALKSQVSELVNKVKKLESENTGLLSRIESLRKESEKNIKSMQSLATNSKESTARKLETEKTLQATTKQMDNYRSQAAEMATQLEKLRADFSTATSNQNSLSKKNQEISTRFAELKQAHDLQVQQLATLSEAMKRNELELESKEKESTKLTATVKQQTALIVELEEKLVALQQDLMQSRALFSEKSISHSKLQSRVSDLQFSYDKISNQVETEKKLYERRLVDAEQELQDVQANYQTEVQKLQSRIDQLNSEAENSKSITAVSQRDNIELLEARSQIENQAAELEMLKANMAALQDKANSLATESMELQSLKKANLDLSKQVQAKSDEAKMAAARWKQIHRDLKDELRKLQRELNAATSGMSGNSISNRPGMLETNFSSSSAGGVGGSAHPRSAIIGAGTEFVSPGYRSTSFTHGSNRRSNHLAMSSSIGGSTSVPPIDPTKPLPPGQLTNIVTATRSSQTFDERTSSPLARSDSAGPNQAQSHSQAQGQGQGKYGQSQFASATSPDTKRSTTVPFSPQIPNSIRGGPPSVSSETSTGNQSSTNDSNLINVDYLRHVLFKFFIQKERRSQLVPVLSLLLKCSPEEIKTLQKMIV